MRCLATLLILLSALSMTACSGRIDLSDLAATGGATTGAVVASVVSANPVPIAIATVAGGVTGAALVEDRSEVDITEVENEFQAEVAETKIFWDFVLTFVEWIIGAIVVLVVIAWLIPGPQFIFRRK